MTAADTARSLALSAMAFAAAGCASLAEVIETPRVSIAELTVVEAGLSSQRFRLALDVENTNLFPLPLARIDYALDVAGQQFAAGSSATAVTLPSLASERIAFDIETDLARSAVQLARLVVGGSREPLDYRLTGGFDVNLPGAADLMRFEASGEVPLTRD